jgi:hypothetical protein
MNDYFLEIIPAATGGLETVATMAAQTKPGSDKLHPMYRLYISFAGNVSRFLLNIYLL